jgi:hypothetical protein
MTITFILLDSYCWLITFTCVHLLVGARGSVVGLGTMLQAGKLWVPFLMRSLDSSIDLTLPAILWPWGLTQPLTEKSTRNLPGIRGDQHVRLTTPLPSVSPVSRKCGSFNVSQPYGHLWPVRKIALLLQFLVTHHFTAYMMSGSLCQ